MERGSIGGRSPSSFPPPTSPWAAPIWPPLPAPGGSRLRLDIEGLRALAVVLVLAYHAHVGPFDGGYLGVDVFFVVSGFLITSLLLDELQRAGFLSLRRFWARRARRLLPASTLVIVTTLLVGTLVLDPLSAAELARDALAAAVFVINIVLARRQSDYLTADRAPSPLLHFWSLALEEQFYVVWPVLLQVLAGYRRHPRAVVSALVVVLWPVSFVACVAFTDTDQPWAFFGLPTRAWELLTGAGLALVVGRIARLPAAIRSVVGWIGLVTIVVAAVEFGATTPFPGPAAIVPVLATAAVIAAGPTALRGPIAMLRRRPLTWIGKRSYSIYLWHWPALVLVAAQFGPQPAWSRVVTVAGAVALAAVTFRFLEDPIHHSRWLAGRARRGLAMGGGLIAIGATTAMLVVTTSPTLVGAGPAAAPVLATAPTLPATLAVAAPAATTAPPPAASAPADGAAPTPLAPPPTTTPATSTPPTSTVPGPDELAAMNGAQLRASLLTDAVPANLRPPVGGARNDVPAIDHDGCNLDAAATVPGPCTFGDPTSTTTVVLFGDSHAAQWFPALDLLASQHHWRLLAMTKKGCPSAAISVFSPMVNRELRECEAWRVNVADRLAVEHPSLILMSSYRYRRQMGAWAGVNANDAWRQGLTTTLDDLAPLAAKVLVLGDTPTPAADVPACVSGHLRSVGKCAAARADAVRDDRLAIERDVAAEHSAAFVSTSDWLCADTGCPVIVGDVLVYRDDNHITATAATWLAPFLEAAVLPLLEPPTPPVPVTTTAAPMAEATPATTVAPTPCAASYIGDSVGTGTLENGLGDALARVGCPLVWEAAYRGMPIGDGAARLGQAATTESTIALVVAGFHDTRSEVGAGRFPARIDAVMQAAGHRLVVWALLAPTAECSASYQQALSTANEELVAAKQRWPNLELLDYPSLLAGHPEYSAHDCPHLVAAGYRALATWLADELRHVVDAHR